MPSFDNQITIDNLRHIFEKGKPLFGGLYIIWIISQKQQQLCLILFHRTEYK